MKDIYDIIAESRKRVGESFALATLVRVEGSGYRRPGARMLICENGHTVGSLSGGCIEEEVALRGLDVIRTGGAATMTFDTRRRFGCHGRIDIFIERVRESFLQDVASALAARRTCVAVTTSEGSFVALSSSAGEAAGFPSASTHQADSEMVRKRGAFPYTAFVQKIEPRLRLLIFGRGPDSNPLHRLAEQVGWEAIEIQDPTDLTITGDHRTAAIVKSHNFGRDFVALAKLLPLNLRYVGLIGPKKRRDELLSQLLEIGVAINAGFFAPSGLDLNAETPEEIALSIVSEIQRVFADGSGQSLRDRKMPIHRTNNTQKPAAKWQKSAR